MKITTRPNYGTKSNKHVYLPSINDGRKSQCANALVSRLQQQQDMNVKDSNMYAINCNSSEIKRISWWTTSHRSEY